MIIVEVGRSFDCQVAFDPMSVRGPGSHKGPGRSHNFITTHLTVQTGIKSGWLRMYKCSFKANQRVVWTMCDRNQKKWKLWLDSGKGFRLYTWRKIPFQKQKIISLVELWDARINKLVFVFAIYLTNYMKFSYTGVNAGSLDEHTWLTLLVKNKNSGKFMN